MDLVASYKMVTDEGQLDSTVFVRFEGYAGRAEGSTAPRTNVYPIAVALEAQQISPFPYSLC